MKVSIIVPIYNVAPYLERCLNSILNQSYRDLEVILVDDGSTDSSHEICDSYAKQDNRIKLLHQRNAGSSAARNTGIENATGECIAFIDSDDWVIKDYIKILVKHMNEHNCEIIIGNYKITESFTEFSENTKPNDTLNIITGRQSIWNIHTAETTKSIQFVVPWGKLYKTELFNSVRFPVGIRVHEECFTTYKLYDQCKRVGYSNREIYYYFQRKGSLINEAFSPQRLHFLESEREQISFFKDKDKELAEVLKKLLIVHSLLYYNLMKFYCPQEKQLRKDILTNIGVKNKLTLLFKKKIRIKHKVKFFIQGYFPHLFFMKT